MMRATVVRFAAGYVSTFAVFWLGMKLYWHHEATARREGWPPRDTARTLAVAMLLAAATVFAVLCALVVVVKVVQITWEG